MAGVRHTGEDAAMLATKACHLSLGFTLARMGFSAGLLPHAWLDNEGRTEDHSWVQALSNGNYGRIFQPFVKASARNGSSDTVIVFLAAASGTFLLSGYLYEVRGLNWNSRRFVKRWLMNFLNATCVVIFTWVILCSLGPKECNHFREGFTLFRMYILALCILLLMKHQLPHFIRRCSGLQRHRDIARDEYFSLKGGPSLEGDEREHFVDYEISEASMREAMQEFRGEVLKASEAATAQYSDPEPKELVKIRGRLLMERHNALSLGRKRILALFSLWMVRMPSMKGVALFDYLLMHFPRWIMFVFFWFHTLMFSIEVVMIPVAYHLRLFDASEGEGCVSFRGYVRTALGAAVLSICIVKAYGRNWVQDSVEDMTKQKKYEWSAATAGFAGKRRFCVVSMSGLDQEFWFGIKDCCKDMGIGFACLWEEDWGDKWWTHWKQNVHDFGVAPGDELVVLVNKCLRLKGKTEEQRHLCLGNAQQSEVAYLKYKKLAVRFYTDEAFAAKLKRLREGGAVEQT